jgi:hypothetical protein
MGTLINICGPSYSGTTMLELMLANAPDAFCCGEVAFWFRPLRTNHLILKCDCGADPCEIWERFKQLPEREFHTAVFNTLGVKYVTDSSKDLSWVVDANRWALESGHEVVNLVLRKSPEAFLYSYWKRRPKRPFHIMLWWYRRYYARLSQLGLPYATVNYHRLSASPAEQLESASRVAGVEYHSGQEQFWKKTHHLLFGNLGTRQQIGRSDAEIREQGGFPPEFLKQLETVKPLLQSRALGKLEARLEALDITRVTPEQVRVTSVPRLQPMWHYRHRLRDVLRKALHWYLPPVEWDRVGRP